MAAAADRPVQPERGSEPAALVEVWRSTLEFEPAVLERLAASLNREERARAARFHFDRDRSRFTVARGLLRLMLGRYLGTPPARLLFGYSPRGKPFLETDPDLGFNISHAGDQLLVGITRGRNIGVDIEQVPTTAVVDAVGDQVFSGPERRALDQRKGMRRRECFARLWTRKEAVIKADGRGMSLPLESIDVWTSAEHPCLFDPARREWHEYDHWTIRTLSAPPGYAAAIAADGPGFEIRAGLWSDLRWPP